MPSKGSNFLLGLQENFYCRQQRKSIKIWKVFTIFNLAKISQNQAKQYFLYKVRADLLHFLGQLSKF